MLMIRTLLIACLAVLPLLLFACDVAQETADGTEQAGEGAVGIAEKMSEGTLGEADDEDF